MPKTAVLQREMVSVGRVWATKKVCVPSMLHYFVKPKAGIH